MSLLQILANSNYLSVNKTLIKLYGLEEAVLLGELCSEYDFWQKTGKLTEDNMFYCSIEKVKENTGLSAYQQRNAIATLEKANILTVTLKGIPATRYFYIDEAQLLSNLTTRCEKTSQLDVKKLHSSNTQIDKNIELDNTNVLSRKAEIDNFLQSDIADKPKKKNLYQKCQESIVEFTIDLEVREKLSEYLGIRLEMAKDKPFGIRTFDSMLKKLRTYTDSKAECLKIIQQSIDRQYLTFYPLKEYKKATRTKENFESMDIQETYKADKEDISIGTQF